MTNVYIVAEFSLELGGSGEKWQKRPATVAVLGSKSRILPQLQSLLSKGEGAGGHSLGSQHSL